MSKIKDRINNTFGSIEAAQTLVNGFPTLDTTGSLTSSLNISTSIGFLLALLKNVGVSETDLVNWLSKLLCGKNVFKQEKENKKVSKAKRVIEAGTGGILDSIEYAIKGILFANIKDMFGGCPVSPIIPDWLIDSRTLDGSIGLKIGIAYIDTFGTLRQCPTDDKGSIYYFDTKPSIFGYNYTPLDVYKSTDFNAFLWHVINKSGSNGDTWDNRFNVKGKLLQDDKLCENFWKTTGTTVIQGSTTDVKVKKKEIINCKYINTGSATDGQGIIKVTLPANTYRIESKLKNTTNQFHINKTIFEFNYDYIYSLKLFDSKTIVSNVINSLLCLTSTIEVGAEVDVSFNQAQALAEQKAEQLINNIMEKDSDDDSTDIYCAAKFSNEKYDKMLKATDDARSCVFTIGNTELQLSQEDAQVIQDKISVISTSVNQEEAIADAINAAADSVSNNLSLPSVDVKYNFSLDFINKFLQQTVKEIILEVMSPKIVMLYAINTAIMGDVTNIEEWKENFTFKSFDDMWDKMENLLSTITSQVITMIVKQLYAFLLEKLSPLLKLFTQKLLLETVKDYKDLLTQILTACGSLGSLGFSLNDDGSISESQIANVDYADIVPTQTAPGNIDC